MEKKKRRRLRNLDKIFWSKLKGELFVLDTDLHSFRDPALFSDRERERTVVYDQVRCCYRRQTSLIVRWAREVLVAVHAQSSLPHLPRLKTWTVSVFCVFATSAKKQ